jgi:hypothetical protein
VRAALEQILDGHGAYPAVTTDRAADLVSGNDAFRRLIGEISPALREPPMNLPRLLLHPDGLASRILNLADWGRHVIDGLRRKALRLPDARLDALIEELAPLVPGRPEPTRFELGFAVPLQLSADDHELDLLTPLTHFATADDVTVSELTLEAFLPANQATADHLSRTSSVVEPAPGQVTRRPRASSHMRAQRARDRGRPASPEAFDLVEARFAERVQLYAEREVTVFVRPRGEVGARLCVGDAVLTHLRSPTVE